MLLTISDKDQPEPAASPRFRVIVIWPRFIERLIERLMRLLNRGA